MWASEPREFCENGGQSDPPPGGCGVAPGLSSRTAFAATLGCEPHYTDWSVYETIHIYHARIVPGGMYRVDVLDRLCDPGVEGSFSPAIELTTSIWGDVVRDCVETRCSPPDGSVDVTMDVTAVLDKFKNLVGAPITARADVEPAIPDQVINISDVLQVLNAFRSRSFPFPPDPLPCPP